MKAPQALTDEEKKERRREQRREWKRRNPDKVRAQRERERAKPDYMARKHAAQSKYMKKYRLRPEVRARYPAQNKARWARIKANPEALEKERARWRRNYGAGDRGWKFTGEALQAALNRNDLYAAVRACVPSYYPRHTRDDIISMIVLAVLEGEFPAANIAVHAKRFIAAYYRESDFHRTVSIDATIPGTDGLRLIDVIAAEPTSWEARA